MVKTVTRISEEDKAKGKVPKKVEMAPIIIETPIDCIVSMTFSSRVP